MAKVIVCDRTVKIMDGENNRVIVVNITWNPSKWRDVYVNPKAGHTYARVHPGHESLNFRFDKGSDSEEEIYGYVQWAKPPKKLATHAVMIFYTLNLDEHIGQIVGIYGDAQIVEPAKKVHHPSFENDELLLDIKARRDLSLLFPIPLDAEKYSGGRRLVPQIGYTYRDTGLAEQIVFDEIHALQQSGIRLDEYRKLKAIYTFITGKEYEDVSESQDELEQDELLAIEAEKTREQIIRDLKGVTPQSPEIVEFRGKQYKRDNKTVAQLKILRNYECQICHQFILKKNGERYIEAAHITPKRHQGPELPHNLLILCPNHHKEFDIGNVKTSLRDAERIIFELNGVTHTIDLSLE
jgi:5-methylcytosine-specific restriction endonuclease McrA